ncbi:MAG: anthranilate phosphoribosyltransferase [Desulfocapsaceae bacterium]|nr:anthranilate phosphoribosyltransferase [Desulfocapsaceae bacterium]
MDIREAIKQVIEGGNLSEDDMVAVMDEVMSGEATSAQIASFITALRIKGETVEEITGAAKVMRKKATRVVTGVDTESGGIVIDTCGTGGDGSGTFNVSTTSAFVVAGHGLTVAKHGNRSISSNCGSADVLEAAGVVLDLSAEDVGRCINEVGIGFLFAPALHGAMKHAIGPRKEIGVRTIFNILGPLTNPAGANVQVLGVFAEELTEPLARVLGKLGARRALVVHGEGNLDELTTTGITRVSELKDEEVTSYTINPADLNLPTSTLEQLRGGATAEEAAVQMQAILDGEQGPKRDMVVLNSGAALMAAGAVIDLTAGIALAGEIIDSGKARAKLDALAAFSKHLQAGR